VAFSLFEMRQQAGDVRQTKRLPSGNLISDILIPLPKRLRQGEIDLWPSILLLSSMAGCSIVILAALIFDFERRCGPPLV